MIWTILKLFISNHGYSTPIQERFKVDEYVLPSPFCITEKIKGLGPLVVLETGRHDYLIQDINLNQHIVYQFEIKRITDGN